MRKCVVLTAFVVVAAVILSGCVAVTLGPSQIQGGGVRGVGEVISFPVETDSFSSVQINGHYDIVYREAPLSSVRFEIHENLVEHLDVKVEQGTLVISSDVNFAFDSPPTVYIYTPRLDGVSIHGAGRMRDWDTVATESFSLWLGGALTGNLPLDVENLDAVVTGAASLRAAGRADTASIGVSGAGDVTARELQTQHAVVDISGAGSVIVAVSDTLNASVAGAGSVRYIGDPNVTQSVAGAGSVRRAE